MSKYEARWTTYTQRIDIDTGELLTQKNAEKNYLLIKTEVKIEYERAVRVKRILKKYKRNPQGKFW